MLLIKAAAFDVDGTLTDGRKWIQPQAIEALRKVQANGYHVMIASGNVLPVVFGLASFIGVKGPLIAENGGIVYYKEKVYKLQNGTIPLQAWEYLKQRMPEAERLFTDHWRETEVALKRSCDVEKVKKILQDWPIEVEVTGFAIHIMEPGHSKLNGVRKGCELLGIDLENVVAFGDSDNDVRMLRGVGFGVAVANASLMAKQAADLVTEAEHADGVIEGLRKLGML
ncbi:MAG: phosphoglycolate phosphatase [Methanomassiliicoccales archaeon]